MTTSPAPTTTSSTHGGSSAISSPSSCANVSPAPPTPHASATSSRTNNLSTAKIARRIRDNAAKSQSLAHDPINPHRHRRPLHRSQHPRTPSAKRFSMSTTPPRPSPPPLLPSTSHHSTVASSLRVSLPSSLPSTTSRSSLDLHHRFPRPPRSLQGNRLTSRPTQILPLRQHLPQ